MKYYIVDAFTDKLFRGNQAGVCFPDEWPDDETMQAIASENNLAETAFAVKCTGCEHESASGAVQYDLRWFTPETEIDLCGHATLASAFVISNFINTGADKMDFHTKSGVLSVKKSDDLFEMDFPARKPSPVSVTSVMERALGVPVSEAYLSRDLLLLVENEATVKKLTPNFKMLAEIPGCFAVIVTAKGDSADFVSRFFAPNAGIPEDPVTGSSHSTLIPFWAERLNKNTMTAKQLSKRGGTLFCEHNGDRVKISGKAVLYLSGEIRC